MSKIDLTVYSKPNCQACLMTKKWLTDRGLAFREADVMTEENLALAERYGVKEAPMVIARLESVEAVFSGFRPDLLERYAPMLAAATTSAATSAKDAS